MMIDDGACLDVHCISALVEEAGSIFQERGTAKLPGPMVSQARRAA